MGSRTNPAGQCPEEESTLPVGRGRGAITLGEERGGMVCGVRREAQLRPDRVRMWWPCCQPAPKGSRAEPRSSGGMRVAGPRAGPECGWKGWT